MNMRSEQLYSVSLIFVGLLAFNSCRREPAAPAPVFLGASYGMTMEKARTALSGEGAQLLSYDDYVRVEAKPLIEKLDFRPLYSEDRVNETVFYMPSIQLWSSRVEAEFTFKQDLLTSIAVYLESVDQPSEAVVNLVDKELRSRYTFKARTDSTEVPGAYSLEFLNEQSRKASFWVNLVDKQKPILIIYFFDGTVLDAEKRQIQERQQRALGPAKR